MINLAVKPSLKPILKQCQHFKLKSLNKLENINIFAMPTRIKDRDIQAMFSGLISLLKEKIKQEESEKYLRLKLKYLRLKYLYNKLKTQSIKEFTS